MANRENQMIVKVAPNRHDGRTSFNDLARYISNGITQSQDSPHRCSFDRLTQYITKDSVLDELGEDVEKTIAVEIGNLACLQTAGPQMAAVAKYSTRVKNPVYHFILSWPEGERPDTQDIFAAARHSLSALGLSEHQYIAAIHANTDNIHCHVEVNKVHPKKHKAARMDFDHEKLHHAARESEIKFGWAHDAGIYEVVEINGKKHIVRANVDLDPALAKSKSRTYRFETWTCDMSLETWCQEKPADSLKKVLASTKTSSWQDVHRVLARFGLELRDSGGGGMKVFDVSEDPTGIKQGKTLVVSASKAFRFLKRKELEERFGAFEPIARNSSVDTDTGEIYDGARRASVEDIEGNLAKASDVLRKIRPIDSTAEHAIRTNFENIADARGTDEQGYGQSEYGSVGVGSDNRGEIDESEYLANITNDLAAAGRSLEKNGRFDSGFEERASARRAHIADYPGTDEPKHRSAQEARGRRADIDRPAGGNEAALSYKRDPAKRLDRRLARKELRDQLHIKFKVEQAKNRAANGEAHKRLKAEARASEKARFDALVKRYGGLRILVRHDPSLNEQSRRLEMTSLRIELFQKKAELKAQFATERSALAKATKQLTWREWVEERAVDGDEAAISALRGILYREKRDGKQPMEDDKVNAILPAVYRDTDPDVRAIDRLVWQVARTGKVIYSFKNGGAGFTDDGDKLTFGRKEVTDEALAMSLQYAAEKWGNKIRISGGDELFKERAAKLAVQLGIEVINPELRYVQQPTKQQVVSVKSAVQKIEAKAALPTSEIPPSDIDVSYQLAVEFTRDCGMPLTQTNRQSGRYSGNVLKLTSHHVVQSVGHGEMVIHARADFEGQNDQMHGRVSIQYRDGKGSVKVRINTKEGRSK